MGTPSAPCEAPPTELRRNSALAVDEEAGEGRGFSLVKAGAGTAEASPTRKRLSCKEPERWNFFDKLTFSWMIKVVPAARARTITVDELPLPRNQGADFCYDEFNAEWETAIKATGDSDEPPSLFKVLWKCYGKELLVAGVFKVIWSVLVILGAFFFTRSILLTIRTLEGKEQTIFDAEWKGWLLAGFFFLDAWLLGLALQRMGYNCVQLGVRVRAALVSTVARKCYNMAELNSELSTAAVGFVATDINKIFDGIQEVHYLYGAPFEAIVILTLLASLVGVYCLPGVAIVCLVVPAQYYFGYRIVKNKIKSGFHVSDRWSVFQEVLPAMKLVKYYAWERFFEKEVADARKGEKKFMYWNAFIKTVNVCMVFAVPPSVAFCTLAPYELRNGTPNEPYLKPQTSFVLLSLFNILRFPLVVLPKALRCASEAFTSIKRLEQFLAQPVVHKRSVTGAPGVEIRDAVFSHRTSDAFVLRVPEFSVKPGELVAVVGRVGAGKSSLLDAILGNMRHLEGSMEVGGQVAYVPQTPWCQNLTLRENILFGKPLDEAYYRQVIHACALDLDLQILADGDQSKAGLRGINLSGGQRQRLNLARAAYFQGELVLLDNALSAVDHHTAQHIFEHCVKNIFRDKATILITHQVQFLSQCDKVAIMNDGDMLYFGPWNQRAQELLSQFLPVTHLLSCTPAVADGAHTTVAEVVTAGSGRDDAARRRPSVAKRQPKASEDEAKGKAAPPGKAVSSLTTKRAIWEYCCEAGWVVFCFSLFCFLTAMTARQMGDYTVRYWTRDQFDKFDDACTGVCKEQFYIMIYGICLFLFITFVFLRGVCLHVWCLGASNRLQRKSTHRVLFAPLGFFLTTPVGDLLVSFTKDQDILDESLVDALHYAAIYGLILLATTITVSTIIPLFSAFVGGLLVVSAIMLALYLPAATYLKKLRTETSSDLVTLVAEALDGLGVIQAFNRQAYFERVTAYKTDLSHKALFGAETLNLWLAFFCDFYGAALILAVACFAIGQWESLGSSSVGLAFSQSIQMLVFYTWSVRLLAESVSLFAAVEKLGFLANHTPQEAGDLEPPALQGQPAPVKEGRGREVRYHQPEVPLPEAWPTVGVVQFENVWMKYAPHLPPALKGVTFMLKHAEKVGVVGRTGSGKSTLLLALYRMFNLEQGRIVLDGVNIATITLPQLRRALSVIPQEPVVFSGTVRSNLDPFNEYGSEERLWEVIRKVGLEKQVKMCGGLDGAVDGTSAAWSLGQKQLVCLARAALKEVPVLCLDEATAAMDPKTEAAVLSVIERVFEQRTVLTIAHRLDTVIKADTVIVMSEGELVERASPACLLADPASMFSALVERSGAESAAALRAQAAQFLAERGAGQ